MPRHENMLSRPVQFPIKEWLALNVYELTWIALAVFGVFFVGTFLNR